MIAPRAPRLFTHWLVRLIAVASGVLVFQPTLASASAYSVNPTKVLLSGSVSSRTVTVRNDSNRPLRFQLSVFTWGQDSRGQMQFAPTVDIIFFPTLLTVAPGEERRVRVGLATKFADAEKTYRLFVEELPEPEGDDAPAHGGVTVLTKMGIPIFLQPGRPFSRGTISNLTLAAGVFHFDVANAGNVHFITDGLRVRGLDANGGVLFERTLDGWYILAGGTQTYDVTLPGAECAHLVVMVAEARVAGSALTGQLQVATPSCRP